MDPKEDSGDEVTEQVDETQEAEGVERVEFAAALGSDQLAALDRESLEEAAEADVRLAERTKLSPNFSLSEFHCKDGTHVPGHTIPGLVRLVEDVLQPMRNQFQRATINSGFRSAAWNDKVRGAPRSFHRYELRPGNAAADVTFANGSPREWADAADRLLGNRGGVATYRGKNFVHVDNRAQRWRSRPV